ncbi:MAG TPA: tetratricopeptide repeat protein [Caulobacteraceae bacterium]|jgi:tetratricopeptide (TPR) repeat protein
MSDAFEEALALHRAGRLNEASARYAAALQERPQHFDAMHMLGVVRLQQGDAAGAVEAIDQALALNGHMAAAHSNKAIALLLLGRPDDAFVAADRAVSLEAANLDAHRSRAAALLAMGRPAEALSGLDAAAALRPDNAILQFDRGNALAALRRDGEALAAFEAAVALAPGYFEAQVNRTAALHRLGRSEDALAAIDQALAMAPASPEAHITRSALLLALNRAEEALSASDQALALRPGIPEAHFNRGNALLALDRAAEALTELDAALAPRPDMANVLNSRGAALQALRRYAEAVATYERAIELAPDHAEARFNRAVALLAQGDFAGGFDAYRWRWRAPHTRMTLPELPCPLWAGESLAGKSIVIHAEQGFGDAIQFIRLVRPLAERATRVTVRCDEALVGLFRSVPGIEPASRFDPSAYDYHLPMLDLPHVLGLTLETILADTPYLAPSPAKLTAWAGRLPLRDGRRRVGLVWAGNARRHNPAAHAIDRRRSLSLAQLAPFKALTDVQFISLQKGEPAVELQRSPFPALNLADDLADFEDTAALIANLDLVVSVDTAVAHLAGALGKPVWILSRFDGCWRWLDGREDSPWYPTARLFHQRRAGDWDEVIGRVVAALA